MNLLLDTQLVVWLSVATHRLPARARDLIQDPANVVYFSVVSIWEVAIKRSLNRPDFTLDPFDLRQTLLAADFAELQVTGPHAAQVVGLPRIHGDPFDRLLLAQAYVEGVQLVTIDKVLARYPGPILHV